MKGIQAGDGNAIVPFCAQEDLLEISSSRIGCADAIHQPLTRIPTRQFLGITIGTLY